MATSGPDGSVPGLEAAFGTDEVDAEIFQLSAAEIRQRTTMLGNSLRGTKSSLDSLRSEIKVRIALVTGRRMSCTWSPVR